MGAWKGYLRPRSDLQFSSSREAFLEQAPGARGGVKVLAPRSDGVGVETWKEEWSQLRLQPSCTTATRT